MAKFRLIIEANQDFLLVSKPETLAGFDLFEEINKMRKESPNLAPLKIDSWDNEVNSTEYNDIEIDIPPEIAKKSKIFKEKGKHFLYTDKNESAMFSKNFVLLCCSVEAKYRKEKVTSKKPFDYLYSDSTFSIFFLYNKSK